MSRRYSLGSFLIQALRMTASLYSGQLLIDPKYPCQAAFHPKDAELRKALIHSVA